VLFEHHRVVGLSVTGIGLRLVPEPDDATVLDPLTELSDEEFDAINKDEDTLFGYLDRLWERGTLPQRIIPR
jgi:hypothetical protein